MRKRLPVHQAFFVLLGSGLIVQCLMFLGVLLLSRVYDPNSFGEFGFYAGIASLVAIIAGLRFDYVGFSQSLYEKNIFYFISIACSTFLLCLIYFASILLGSYLVERPGFSWILLLFCASASLFHLGTQYLIANGEYKLFSYLRFVQALLQVGIGLLLYKKSPHFGLATAFALSQTLIGVVIILIHWKQLFYVSIVQVLACWNEFKSKAFANSLICVLQYSTPFAPLIIAGFLFSKSDTGAYFLFSQAIAAPLAIFRRSFINFLNGEAADIEGAKSIIRKYRKYLLSSAVGYFTFIFFGAAVICFFGDEISSFVFGSKWREYGFLLLPLFIYFLLDAVLQPLTTLLPLWGFYGLVIKYELLRFLLVFVFVPLIVNGLCLSFLNFLLMYFFAMLFVYILISNGVASKIKAVKCLVE